MYCAGKWNILFSSNCRCLTDLWGYKSPSSPLINKWRPGWTALSWIYTQSEGWDYLQKNFTFLPESFVYFHCNVLVYTKKLWPPHWISGLEVLFLTYEAHMSDFTSDCDLLTFGSFPDLLVLKAEWHTYTRQKKLKCYNSVILNSFHLATTEVPMYYITVTLTCTAKDTAKEWLKDLRGRDTVDQN